MSNNENKMIKENMQAAVDLMEKGVAGTVECIKGFDKQNKKMDELINYFKL